MKKKSISEKSTIVVDWFELYDLKKAIKQIIKDQIELENKILNVKFPFYETDKDLVSLYKKVIKAFKNYK